MKTKRNRVEIQVFLKRKGITQAQIADAVDLHRCTVTRTINGERNNKNILRKLKSIGVPVSYLG